MKIPGARTTALLVANAALAVVAVIAVLLDRIALAVLCAVALQSLTMLVVLISVRRQGDIVTKVDRQIIAVDHVTRRLDNVEERSITEFRAVRNIVADRAHKMRVLIERRSEHLVQDVEAMFQLFARFQPRAALPSAGGWALDPSAILRIVDLVSTKPIRTVVELGSGTSTLWIAYALEARGMGGRVIALDHDPHFATLSRTSLVAHGFDNGIADVRDAPLVPGVIENHPTLWYDPKSFADIGEIDLLIVDGPPEGTGPMARFPAFPILLDRLAEGAIVVIDDADRDDETLMVQQWQEAVPRLQALEESGPGQQRVLILGAPPESG